MAKVWVLDTETKGTGAHVVPLEKTLRKAPGSEPLYVPPEPAPRSEPEPAPAPPRRFKVVDVQTSAVLAEGADTRATVDLLAALDSVVDVRIYVWQPTAESWRLLTLGEQKALWGFRER
jgi:hypothetical protein